VRQRTLALGLLAGLAACGPRPRGAVSPGGGVVVRVALDTDAPSVTVSATERWRLTSGDGAELAAAPAGAAWTLAASGGRVRIVDPRGRVLGERSGALIVRGDGGGLVIAGGRRYRGDLSVSASTAGLVVINRLPLEAYLRGVVPLELGRRSPGELAAVEAQAVAARSFTVARMDAARARRADWDVVAGVADQAYSGADAEDALSDEGVARTAGLALWFDGRVVLAPYHSTCGGRTAAPDEVWNEGLAAPWLRSVSDRVPGTDRFWCDISPRFRWAETLDADALNAAVARYLGRVAAVPAAGPGTVRDVRVDETTPSGRVGRLTIVTTRGRFTVRGNDVRSVLRRPGGAILGSTYFSLATRRDDAGRLMALTLDGHGSGHGVGMCQWGAIGRARAGEDFRTILRTYYPGTTIASVQ
jgi:stage II sporulation protein D